MSVEMAFSCDVCGKKKEQSNHWFLYGVNLFQAFICDGVKPQHFLVFIPWHPHLLHSKNLGHVCGPGCAAKKQQQWMDDEAKRGVCPLLSTATHFFKDSNY